MAVVNQILYRKNSNNKYDIIYLKANMANVTGILAVANGGTGTNTITDVEAIDMPEPYVHPSTKQCNYSYTHPSVKQCDYSYTHPTTKQCDAAAGTHNQEASTITAGTFAGKVVANSNAELYSDYCLRNQRLNNTDTNPTVNGEICWTYG